LIISAATLTYEIGCWVLLGMGQIIADEHNETGVITAGSAMPRRVPWTEGSHSSEAGGSGSSGLFPPAFYEINNLKI
jgi:hypothetical protein